MAAPSVTNRVLAQDLPMTENDFLHLGLSTMAPKYRGRSRTPMLRKFSSFFGAKPLVLAVLWDMLLDWTRARRTCSPKHLLWCMHWMTTYNSLESVASRFNVCEKTFGDWSWWMLTGISSLSRDVVSGVVSSGRWIRLNPILTSFVSDCSLSHADPAVRSIRRGYWSKGLDGYRWGGFPYQ